MSKTIKLSYPITYIDKDNEERTIDEITFHRFKVKHLKKMPQDFMNDEGIVSPEAFAKFLELSSKLPETAIDEIDMSDFEKIGDAITDSLGAAPKNWKEIVWGIAYTFKMLPQEIGELTLDNEDWVGNLLFWDKGCHKISQWAKTKRG